METIILNNSPEEVKISCKNRNNSIENIDPLINQEKKKKKQNKNRTKNKKTKKKSTSLKDLLDDINKNKTTTKNQKITENNINEKNDISEIKISEELEIESKAIDVSELNVNEFKDLNNSSKTEINSSNHKNFPKKIISIEDEQINDNDKIKTNFSIFDYYNGYDKYLSGSEISTINLSNSLNFIKKEKLGENFSEENNNSNISAIEDFVINNNSNINKNINFVNDNLQDNSNINNDINNSLRNTNKIKRNINKDLKNISNNFYDCKFESLENSKYLNHNSYKKEKEFEPNYSKFDFYNNDHNITYKFNFNENHRGRRRLWICKYCGNDNYHFRDFCHICNNSRFYYGNQLHF